MALIDQYAREWEQNAKIDPYWAILTDPEKTKNKWDPQEFFQTGEKEVQTLFSYMNQKPRLALQAKNAVLDF
ncbi:MAG: hypothetical protein WC371_05365, partial [Parachlamydiales bacterium]